MKIIKLILSLNIFTLLCIPLVSHAAWYSNDWQYRLQATSNPVVTAANETSIPVLVDLSILPPHFWSNVKPDGSDILVTAADETTVLLRELVAIDTTANTGELYVLMPTLDATTGTDIYIYYGNATANEVNSPSVWSNYRGVWHMQEAIVVASGSKVGMVGQVAMDGGDGSWAVLYGDSPVTSTINMAVDEDQISDAEREHTNEQLAYWVFDSIDSLDIYDQTATIIGETGIIPLVGSAAQVVSLRNTYVNPVVLTVPKMTNATQAPVITRVENVSTNQFSVYRQNPGGLVAPSIDDVYYMVVEAGDYLLPGGVPLEAGTGTVTGVNRSGNWNNNQMLQISPVHTYTTPVVMGQVMTTNDASWQTFWTSNGTQTGPPNNSAIYIGRHTGAQNQARAAETLGYIIIEQAAGTMGGTLWESGIGADIVTGVGNTPPYKYNAPGSILPGGFNDSTINGFNAGYNGGVTAQQPGALGNAVGLDGTSDTYLPINGLLYNQSNSLNELTAELWINTTDTARSGIFDFDRSEHWEIGLNFHNTAGKAGTISFDTSNSADYIRDLNSVATVNDGNWHHVVVVFDKNDPTDKKIYIDGVLDIAANQHTTALGRGTTRYGFFGDGSEASSYDANRNNILFEGLIDEARIQHTAESGDRILTRYNNLSDNATFWNAITAQTRNVAPLAATELYFNHTSALTGAVNPQNVPVYGSASLLPYFTAIYNDPDTGDTASQVIIQVSTDPTFTSVTHWDSGAAAITTVTEGSRTVNIEYGSIGNTATLPLAMDDGLTSYYWRTAFIDAVGAVGPFSTPASFSLLDSPVDPSNISVSKVTGTPDTFIVTWQDTSIIEDYFDVQRKVDTGGGFGGFISIGTSTSTTLHDLTTVSNAAYMYRVSTCNYAGCSVYILDPFTHYTDPAAPADVFSIYNSDTQFTTNYTDRSILNMVDIDRCNGITNCAAGTFQVVGTDTTVQNVPDSIVDDGTGLVTDNAYRWRTRANNGSTNSEYTYSIYEYTTPSTPGSFAAAYVNDNAINLSWVDTSAYEDGFRISVAENSGAQTELTSGVNTTSAGDTAYNYVDTSPNSAYTFTIVAHIGDTLNNAELFSTAATSATVYTTPAVATNVAASYVANNNINVTWNDNALYESGYHIYVSEDGGPFIQHATTAADVSSYTYNSGTANHTYNFKVEAFIASNPPVNPFNLTALSVASSPVVYTSPIAPVLTGSNITSSTIDWSWTDGSAYESGYEVFNGSGSSVKDLPVPNATDWTEVSLGPDTLISRTVRSYIQNGFTKTYSPNSNIVTFRTLADPPSALTGAELPTETITLTWGSGSNPPTVEYYAENITTGFSVGWAPNLFTLVDTNIDCQTNYEYIVKTRNQDLVETSDLIEITTADCPIVELGGTSGATRSSGGGGRGTFNIASSSSESLDETEDKNVCELKPASTALRANNNKLETIINGTAVVFNDVGIDDWYAVVIDTLVKANIISGYQDRLKQPTGEYGPADTLTKAQFTKMVVNAANLKNVSEQEIAVPDSTHWSAEFFERLYTHGDSIFSELPAAELEDQITRAEVASLIVSSFNIEKNENGITLNYRDVNTATTFIEDINIVNSSCIMQGHDGTEIDGQKTFEPTSPINRAEAAMVLWRAMEVEGLFNK